MATTPRTPEMEKQIKEIEAANRAHYARKQAEWQQTKSQGFAQAEAKQNQTNQKLNNAQSKLRPTSNGLTSTSSSSPDWEQAQKLSNDFSKYMNADTSKMDQEEKEAYLKSGDSLVNRAAGREYEDEDEDDDNIDSEDYNQFYPDQNVNNEDDNNGIIDYNPDDDDTTNSGDDKEGGKNKEKDKGKDDKGDKGKGKGDDGDGKNPAKGVRNKLSRNARDQDEAKKGKKTTKASLDKAAMATGLPPISVLEKLSGAAPGSETASAVDDFKQAVADAPDPLKPQKSPAVRRAATRIKNSVKQMKHPLGFIKNCLGCNKITGDLSGKIMGGGLGGMVGDFPGCSKMILILFTGGLGLVAGVISMVTLL